MSIKHIACSLIVIAIFTGCHTNTWVFTPDPKDYPCHNADGSAAMDADWCYPVDGTHTCCLGGQVCKANDGCVTPSYNPNSDQQLGTHPTNQSVGDGKRVLDATGEKLSASSR